ncbi:tetracycline transporter [Blastomyces gilchristii SLH14081]|uniref:Tetracycline transporter n=1 Tax=Blastomyces gilchristii (strain SLH14081) TaxID=559298 RepID=A0A179UVN7_BLAGS|nr:tetracycline transporter [Blastomyces gilchristii SLH14081]OAT11111.1 tetracycline transporter [Blastomyces gilchristii SLH14081]
MAATTVSPSRRKQILKVLFISLLLDLISFTFILPLFPSLLAFYLNRNPSPTSLLHRILHYLNAYKNAFARPIDSRYDVVLLGGALGSLFSFLQAIAAPFIGHLSDNHGRRTALLCSMAGNIASVALWVAATDFRTFLGSRIVGGLSEGNVQIANAIATDISDEGQRGATMALVGACFSVAFTFGPAMGAALAGITTVADNPFATAAGCSLLLIVVETVYIYFCLPETHPRFAKLRKDSPTATATAGGESNGNAMKAERKSSSDINITPTPKKEYTNPPILLNLTHFLFLLPFSGLEFSLPFLTTTLYASTNPSLSPSALNGRLLSVMGLLASLLQGTVVRRLPPLLTVRIGVAACTLSFFLLSRVSTVSGLYGAGCLLAVTSATVVTGLNSLGSLEAGEGERGAFLGRLRSWGQAGRASGPIVFCTLFWWAGREVAYMVGGLGMLAVCALVFGGLKAPGVSKKVR